ncbi:MAG: hypothetical protein J6W74_05795 [Bacteroidales bacterium]|nr:hypothetical protein [Bacteroidales bacterium]
MEISMDVYSIVDFSVFETIDSFTEKANMQFYDDDYWKYASLIIYIDNHEKKCLVCCEQISTDSDIAYFTKKTDVYGVCYYNGLTFFLSGTKMPHWFNNTFRQDTIQFSNNSNKYDVGYQIELKSNCDERLFISAVLSPDFFNIYPITLKHYDNDFSWVDNIKTGLHVLEFEQFNSVYKDLFSEMKSIVENTAFPIDEQGIYKLYVVPDSEGYYLVLAPVMHRRKTLGGFDFVIMDYPNITGVVQDGETWFILKDVIQNLFIPSGTKAKRSLVVEEIEPFTYDEGQCLTYMFYLKDELSLIALWFEC